MVKQWNGDGWGPEQAEIEATEATEAVEAVEAVEAEANGLEARVGAGQDPRLGVGLPEAPVVAWTKFRAGPFVWSLTIRAAGTRQEIFDALRLTREIISLVGVAAEKYGWEPLDENGQVHQAHAREAPKAGNGTAKAAPAAAAAPAPAPARAQVDQVARAEAAGGTFITWTPDTFSLEYKPDGERVIRFRGGKWKKYGLPLYVELHEVIADWVDLERLEPGVTYKWPGPPLLVEMRDGKPYKVVGVKD